MSDRGDDIPPSLEDVAHLDAALDALGEERRPEPRHMSAEESRLHMLAAQMRLARDGVEEPTPEFLGMLERTLGEAVTRQRKASVRGGVSRWRFLRAAAGTTAAAGLVGLGVAADEVQRAARQPRELVGEQGRWYDIAAAGELAAGQMKAFAAGGVLGYLVNDGQKLRAVSAICTHMGCRLKPASTGLAFHCLCHGSRFTADGRVVSGLAPDPLPHIEVRIHGGRVYARGTAEDI